MKRYIVYTCIMDCNYKIMTLTEKKAQAFRNSGYIVEEL